MLWALSLAAVGLHEADYSTPSSAEFNSAWSYTFTQHFLNNSNSTDKYDDDHHHHHQQQPQPLPHVLTYQDVECSSGVALHF